LWKKNRLRSKSLAVPNLGEVGGKKYAMILIKMVRVVNEMKFKKEIMVAHFDFSSAQAQPNKILNAVEEEQ
tara:strand:- start:162 stop:374 length:213 start_codon:yes stop_codon:yes gene_type:complete